MNKRTTEVCVLFIAVLALVCLPGALSADGVKPLPVDKETAAHAGGGPLIEEMMILDNTFREVVSGVALGDGKRVHKALEAMHGTMEKTHAGVNEGTVKIPGNTQHVREFVKLDKKFHHQLESLAEAANVNDQKKMLMLTKRLLDGCVSCHRSFRK